MEKKHICGPLKSEANSFALPAKESYDSMANQHRPINFRFGVMPIPKKYCFFGFGGKLCDAFGTSVYCFQAWLVQPQPSQRAEIRPQDLFLGLWHPQCRDRQLPDGGVSLGYGCLGRRTRRAVTSCRVTRAGRHAPWWRGGSSPHRGAGAALHHRPPPSCRCPADRHTRPATPRPGGRGGCR